MEYELDLCGENNDAGETSQKKREGGWVRSFSGAPKNIPVLRIYPQKWYIVD